MLHCGLVISIINGGKMRYLVAVLAGSVVCIQSEIQQSAGWLVSWSSSRPLLGSFAGGQRKMFLHGS